MTPRKETPATRTRPDPSDPEVLRENTAIPARQFAAQKRDVLIEALRGRIHQLEAQVAAALNALIDPDEHDGDAARMNRAIGILED